MTPLLTRCRHALDPAAFARERLGFHADPHQERVLDPTVRRGILNCTRQWGKSTTTAAKAVHHVFHHPGALAIVAAPSARQSGELIGKASAFLRQLDLSPRGDGRNPLSLLLPNGARLVGLPGREGTIRGFSRVSLLLIDEASRVPDDLYHAVRPMVAANAEAAAIWLMSTPNGKQGFFYQEWTRIQAEDTARQQWTRIRVPATDCPRISPAYLAEEQAHMTDQTFRQEYLCEFTAADNAYFDPAAIDDAFHSEHEAEALKL